MSAVQEVSDRIVEAASLAITSETCQQAISRAIQKEGTIFSVMRAKNNAIAAGVRNELAHCLLDGLLTAPIEWSDEGPVIRIKGQDEPVHVYLRGFG